MLCAAYYMDDDEDDNVDDDADYDEDCDDDDADVLRKRMMKMEMMTKTAEDANDYVDDPNNDDDSGPW